MNDDFIAIEEVDTNDYDPTTDEIIEYAKSLGMDLRHDQKYLYIAEEGIKAPLPNNWKAFLNKENNIFYKNMISKEKTFEHPLDQYYKQKFMDAKQKDLSAKKPKLSQQPSVQKKTPALSKLIPINEKQNNKKGLLGEIKKPKIEEYSSSKDKNFYTGAKSTINELTKDLSPVKIEPVVNPIKMKEQMDFNLPEKEDLEQTDDFIEIKQEFEEKLENFKRDKLKEIKEMSESNTIKEKQLLKRRTNEINNEYNILKEKKISEIKENFKNRELNEEKNEIERKINKLIENEKKDEIEKIENNFSEKERKLNEKFRENLLKKCEENANEIDREIEQRKNNLRINKEDNQQKNEKINKLEKNFNEYDRFSIDLEYDEIIKDFQDTEKLTQRKKFKEFTDSLEKMYANEQNTINSYEKNEILTKYERRRDLKEIFERKLKLLRNELENKYEEELSYIELNEKNRVKFRLENELERKFHYQIDEYKNNQKERKVSLLEQIQKKRRDIKKITTDKLESNYELRQPNYSEGINAVLFLIEGKKKNLSKIEESNKMLNEELLNIKQSINELKQQNFDEKNSEKHIIHDKMKKITENILNIKNQIKNSGGKKERNKSFAFENFSNLNNSLEEKAKHLRQNKSFTLDQQIEEIQNKNSLEFEYLTNQLDMTTGQKHNNLNNKNWHFILEKENKILLDHKHKLVRDKMQIKNIQKKLENDLEQYKSGLSSKEDHPYKKEILQNIRDGLNYQIRRLNSEIHQLREFEISLKRKETLLEKLKNFHLFLLDPNNTNINMYDWVKFEELFQNYQNIILPETQLDLFEKNFNLDFAEDKYDIRFDKESKEFYDYLQKQQVLLQEKQDFQQILSSRANTQRNKNYFSMNRGANSQLGQKNIWKTTDYKDILNNLDTSLGGLQSDVINFSSFKSIKNYHETGQTMKNFFQNHNVFLKNLKFEVTKGMYNRSYNLKFDNLL